MKININAKKTFLFPGTGSQYVGMGKDLYENSARARSLYDQANEILGFNLSNICFNGKKELLEKTEVCHPAIMVTSLAIIEGLKEQSNNDITCSSVAGLSLGEYTALVFAGAIEFKDAIKLVHNVGKHIDENCNVNPGGMIAVIGLDDSTIENICSEARWAGEATPANYNYPDHIVISGDRTALEVVRSIAKERGARAVFRLQANGAFHSHLMTPARAKLESELKKIKISEAKIPVISNIDGRYIHKPEDICASLIKQLTHLVLWSHSIQNLIRDGVEEFNGIGPSRAMGGIVRRIDNNKKIRNFDSFNSFSNN